MDASTARYGITLSRNAVSSVRNRDRRQGDRLFSVRRRDDRSGAQGGAGQAAAKPARVGRRARRCSCCSRSTCGRCRGRRPIPSCLSSRPAWRLAPRPWCCCSPSSGGAESGRISASRCQNPENAIISDPCPTPASKSPTRSAGVSCRSRRAQFEIGRRETNDLRLAGSEVSRDHAEIDRRGQPVPDPRQELALRHLRQRRAGDRAAARARRPHPARPQRRRRDGVPPRRQRARRRTRPRRPRSATCARSRRSSKACARSARGRVLDDVLALVLDSAIEVSGAERGFIMLADADRRARVQDGARRAAADRCPAAASPPAARFPKRSSAPASRASSPTCSTASWPTCTWAPSRSASATCCACRCGWCATSIAPRPSGEERRIGVLYLDSREKGSLLSSSTRAALETLATEAAVAIENARLYRETMEKARMEQEMRIAAEIQQALLPKAGRVGRVLPRGGRVAAVPLDRRRFLRLRRSARRRVRLRARRRGGQGPAGGAAERDDAGHVRGAGRGQRFAVADDRTREPGALPARDRVALRDADVRRRCEPDGQLTVLQRRPQPAARGRQERRSGGSSAAGRSSASSRARATRRRRSRSRPATGSSSSATACPRRCRRPARSTAKSRILDRRPSAPRRSSRRSCSRRVFADVREFAKGAAQSDDITAMVLRYGIMTALGRRERIAVWPLARRRGRGLERRLRPAARAQHRRPTCSSRRMHQAGLGPSASTCTSALRRRRPSRPSGSRRSGPRPASAWRGMMTIRPHRDREPAGLVPRHAPADPRLERDRRRRSRRSSCSTTRRCATGCSRRRCGARRSTRSCGSCTSSTRLGIDTADIGLPGAGPHVVRDVERLAREIADAAAARDGQLRRADARRRHQADRRDLAARRASRSSAARSSARARCGSTPRAGRIDQLLQLTEEAITLRGGRGAAGHVRDRGHDARRSRHAAPALLDGDPRRRVARLRRRHRRPRDAGRARRRSCGSSRRSSRSAAAASGSTGTATAIATSRSSTRSPRSRPARRGCTATAHRHRRARRQHADGHAARQPRADGLHRARPVGARRVLRGRLGGDRRADSAELSGRRPRRVPDRHRRARRRGHQGVPEEGPGARRRGLSGVPASLVGREQEIEVGPMSGKSNVVFWLEKRGLPATDEIVERIFAKAKASSTVLTRRSEILALCH